MRSRPSSGVMFHRPADDDVCDAEISASTAGDSQQGGGTWGECSAHSASPPPSPISSTLCLFSCSKSANFPFLGAGSEIKNKGVSQERSVIHTLIGEI